MKFSHLYAHKNNKVNAKNGEMGVGDFLKSPRPIFIEKKGVGNKLFCIRPIQFYKCEKQEKMAGRKGVLKNLFCIRPKLPV